MINLEAWNNTQSYMRYAGLALIRCALTLHCWTSLPLRADNTLWFRLATVLEEVTANESQRSLLGRAVPATNHIAPLEALNKLLRQLKPKLATRKLHCCRRSVKDVCVGNGGHKKVHKHLLPPLVASLGDGIVLVVRIDSPHILSVVFDCGRLLEFGVTTALLHYS